ncbi:hypothetical protein LINPERPRIM_LOCUS15237 [Linum perenne]
MSVSSICSMIQTVRQTRSFWRPWRTLA